MSPTLTPDQIQDLVTIAFCLEPLADKPGCTTRTHDIPGKPLMDFLIAGINVGKYFRLLANDITHNPSSEIFSHYSEALQGSNKYKSPKTINFGLLEIMFPAVYARLLAPSYDMVADTMLACMQRTSPNDVQHLIAARHIAWQTSSNEEKRSFQAVPYQDAQSPWEFYQRLHSNNPSNNSSHQWVQEYFDGLPIIRRVMDGLRNTPTDLSRATAEVYVAITREQPQLKTGIIADMCAAAIFLHLSYL